MSAANEAKAVFESMDTNGDGELDAQELQCRLSDFGVEVRLPRCSRPAGACRLPSPLLWSGVHCRC